MSTEQTIVDQAEPSLDDFSTEFFGQSNVETDPAKSEDQVEPDESDAPTIEDTHEEPTDEGEASEDGTNDDLEEIEEATISNP